MKKHCWIVLACGMLVAAEPPKSIEGKWEVFAIGVSGKEMSSNSVKGEVMEFKGDTFTFFIKGEKRTAGKIKIDTSKTPATIDLIYTEGSPKGKTYPGIFKCDGLVLVINLAVMNDPRPTKFETTAGASSPVMYTYKSIK